MPASRPLVAFAAALLLPLAPATAQAPRGPQAPNPEELQRQDRAREAAAEAAEENRETIAQSIAAPPATPDNVWVLDLSNGQRVSIQLRPDQAPNHVERVKTLTRQGFYNGLAFHRVIDGFMAQGGDPEGTGQGGSTLPDLNAEFNDLPHVRGVVSAARTQQPNSANSQFFIMLMPRLTLDRNYTAFGRVLSGMGGVDGIAKGEPPAEPTRIARAYIQADGVPQAVATLPPPAATAAATTTAVPGTAPIAAPPSGRPNGG